jgi:hypothetical protein
MSKCIHNKSKCRECHKYNFFIHDKRKEFCKECGNSQFCIHNIQKAKCKDCGGCQICIHDKFKSRCKECGGNKLCIHNKLGKKLIINEESSKYDSLNLEKLEKKKETYNDKRENRGVFISKIEKAPNADLNGAINIMRKVKIEEYLYLK